MNYLEDMWGESVVVGDLVIASRPAGAGTTELEFCEVTKINEKSVSLCPLERDGTPKMEKQYNRKTREWGEGPKKTFSLQKDYGTSDKCKKIVRHHG